MTVSTRLAELQPEIAGWRRHMHMNPELGFEVSETAAFIAERLRAFGVDEIVTGIGRTGVVAVIKGNRPGGNRAIGLRADMDALPIAETSGKPWASSKPGFMHACGHDGHSAMLLGAAKVLAETRNFSGRAVLIFQPAEEAGGGGREMVEDGLMDRFGISEVYGMHNSPGLPVGHFATAPGPLLASCDTLTIEIEGKGGHAAMPHKCADPVLAGAAIVMALQQVVARTIEPTVGAVVSITCFNAGFTDNVIPQTAKLVGTVRSLDPTVRDHLQARITAIAEATAAAYGTRATVGYKREYPVVVNHPEQTDFALEAARDVAGSDKVIDNQPAELGAEDFAYMLEARPGAFIYCGNGPSAGLHHPDYDFDDAALSPGAEFWVRLVERRLRAS
jgi:hippurate hydrolase